MKKKKIYRGKILDLSVYEGKIEKRYVKREMIEHRGAAAMIGFDEKNRIILVKQHRFPHGYVLEIPAGTLEKGEKPTECAFREMKEETGYSAKKMKHLVSYHPSIGYNTEIIHCYVASGLKKVSDIDPDNDEFISVVKMDLRKLLRLIMQGKILDSKTICAVLTYTAKKNLSKLII
ncbi:MAG: NUDIX domain-containing protein [Nitrosopumilaceae archaeon]|nr:NUDIX hydrolase [Nitrosopumilaceae archaeon]NIU00806.1 NUDIX hydrolase [Nitrosopumilaceae archaeon]NIU87259.1 NUDIX domain-containing protein [Nitrosopumilaceae archaeon]NIV65787.1 NUDIX domain-containing protein [Nitrosopumilaceae archaeon]NIX61408.1 NUDIX domain-containing protein [Nitrosopumilaceae archaeon]